VINYLIIPVWQWLRCHCSWAADWQWAQRCPVLSW